MSRISVRLAVASALAAAHSAHAQTSTTPPAQLPSVVVTGNPLGSELFELVTPVSVLEGPALFQQRRSTLGETVGELPGISATGFGPNASRPVIRGMEGDRIRMLENGNGMMDASSVSPDHAVALDPLVVDRVEVVRGPAALLYGSGAIGGLVNIVNDRIPTALEPRRTGETELRYSTVDQGKLASFSADASSGNIGLHADGSALNAGDYRIPGNSSVSGDGDQGRLSFSGNRERSLGFGASLVKDWGYVGASVATLDKLYGVRGADEKSSIDLYQTRIDLDSLVRSPFEGIEKMRFRLGNTDYKHTELEGGTDPHMRFTNRSTEARLEMSHLPRSGWRGTFGLHTEFNNTEAANLEGGNPTVPRTNSQSFAAFTVEERDFGDVRVNVGGRLESVSRKPLAATDRSFGLASLSTGALWTFTPGYGLGATYAFAQRAPTAEELYSKGPHHPTETYDIGDSQLKKETSNNFDVSLQKTEDKLRWKTNVYQNKVQDFIYGAIGDVNLDPNGELRDRSFRQADATLRGVEAELSYNLSDPGWFGRLFADSSRGKLDQLGNLPLQPTTRTGLNVGYQDSRWRSTLSVLHADAHRRIASSSLSQETPTDAYTRVDASISYVQRYANADLTWFLLARNLLNEDIRLSTSLLKDYVPQPGRNVVIGVRTRF